MVRALLERGANFNQAMEDDITPLHIASESGNIAVVGALLDRGVDINQTMRDGATPLFIASENGHEEVVRVLNDHIAAVGAGVSVATSDGGGGVGAVTGGENLEATIGAVSGAYVENAQEQAKVL